MKQVGQKFFTLTIVVTLMCLSDMAFAYDNQPVPQPPSNSYAQIKPEPPQEQRRSQTSEYPGYTQIKPESPRELGDVLNRFGPESQDKTLLADPSQMERLAQVSEYWIGVQCGEIMQALRYHLNLDEQEGMLVEQVVSESPAAKCGVEQYDVILTVNGKPVKAIEDIIQAVGEVKDGELTMSTIRKGKPMELKVTPEKRPDSARIPAMPPRQRMFRSIEPGVMIEEEMTPGSNQIPDGLRQMMEQIQKQMEERMKNLSELEHFFRIETIPGSELPPGYDLQHHYAWPSTAPSTIQISIEPARGDMEATLTVRKNGQTWSVSQFSDLPESVQKDVAEVLENTVDGKDVAGWIADQMKSNRRMTFSVSVSGNAPEAK